MVHSKASCFSTQICVATRALHEDACGTKDRRVLRIALKTPKAFLTGTFPTPSLGPHRTTVASGRGSLQVRAAEKSGFNPETMEVLGIPGVKIVPEDTMSKQVLETGSSASQAERMTAGTQTGEKAADDIALELEWDPENLFGKLPQDTDHIERRLLARQAEQKEQEEEKAKEEYERARAELEEYRASRVMPRNDASAMLTYMLETEINELEFECVRCKEELNASFFQFIEDEITASEDSEYIEKLKTISTTIKDFTKFVEVNVAALAAPVDRLKKVLTAKDKKATIAQMGADGEIDTALLALLQTNINTARQAQQTEAAEFMQKVFNACSKFVE